MEDKDCLFCKIIRGEIPSRKVYEDEELFAFHDIVPQAPIHVLVCTKKHIDRVVHMEPGDEELIGKVVFRAKEIAKELKVTEGFRLVFNNGAPAGQSVWHVHVHLLGGRTFTWPPG